MSEREISVAVGPGSLGPKKIVGFVRYEDDIELQGKVNSGKYYHMHFDLVKPKVVGVTNNKPTNDIWVILSKGAPGFKDFVGIVSAKDKEELLKKVNWHYLPMVFEPVGEHLLISKDGEFFFICKKAEEIK